MANKELTREQRIDQIHMQLIARKFTREAFYDNLGKLYSRAFEWLRLELQADNALQAEARSIEHKKPQEWVKLLSRHAAKKGKISLQRTLANTGPLVKEAMPLLPKNSVELREIVGYIVDFMEEPDEKIRRQILDAALLKFGLHFSFILNNLKGIVSVATAELLAETMLNTILDWPNRVRLSDRTVDADARRVLLAIDFLDNFGPEFIGWASDILLSLPQGHPLRNDNRLQKELLKYANKILKAGHLDEFVHEAGKMLLTGLVEKTEAVTIVEQLIKLADKQGTDDLKLEQRTRDRALSIAAAWHLLQAIENRQSDPESAARHREASSALMSEGYSPSKVIQAFNLDEIGHRREAAELLASLPYNEVIGEIEGQMRVDLGDYERAIALLEDVVPIYEERYLNALRSETIHAAGLKYSENAINLSFAYAFKGRWGDALTTLDRTRSLRARHKMKLRQRSSDTELLKLEAMMAAAIRGVPDLETVEFDNENDPVGHRLSSLERAIERYRNKRPDLQFAVLPTPTISDIGATLARDEAIVSLGLGTKGLMIIILLFGDSLRPSGTFLPEDYPNELFSVMFAYWDMICGWEHELHPIHFKKVPIDPEKSLEEFLKIVDTEFGTKITKFLLSHDISRVTIVPHRMLHVIPFWALPSFEGLDTRVAPSLAQWYQARERIAVLSKQVTSVGNPTLDLPLAAAEAESIKVLLATRGCATNVLLGTDAHESAIRNSAQKSTLLHFAGHGKARSTEPLLSALLTHPDQKWGWPTKGDPLASLASSVSEWKRTPEGSRYTDLDNGRLIEEINNKGELTQRRLEHASKGTLWGQYYGGELLQVAELWTTSDILIEETLTNCSVAYLSACESGHAAFRNDIDEDVSLPSALQMAGVETVVCTLWPVSEKAAFLFAILFYRYLSVQPNGEIDLCAIIADCRRSLASLHKDDATTILCETATQVGGRVIQAHLNYLMEDINHGTDYPFAHPWNWAAFFTQGAERVDLRWE